MIFSPKKKKLVKDKTLDYLTLHDRIWIKLFVLDDISRYKIIKTAVSCSFQAHILAFGIIAEV